MKNKVKQLLCKHTFMKSLSNKETTTDIDITKYRCIKCHKDILIKEVRDNA